MKMIIYAKKSFFELKNYVWDNSFIWFFIVFYHNNFPEKCILAALLWTNFLFSQ
jgi:hypothetical protein